MLDSKMNHVLETWLENPLLRYDEVAEKAGISVRAFYDYRQNPEFVAEYNRRCDEWFGSLKCKAIEVIGNAIEDGDVKAAQWLADRVGYAPKTQVEVSTPNTVKISITE